MHHILKPVLAATAVAMMLSVSPALAEVLNFKAELKGASEVPPNDSTGTGTVDATFDTETKVLTWTINYEGLTGAATGAHFHGPAAEDAVADPVVPVEGDLASPISGNATLDDQQSSEVQSGMWYFNIHTEQYPDGELRAQLKQATAM